MIVPEDKLGPIKEAIFSGQKITAIKLYREASGAGLADAKNEVEKMEAELRGTAPEEFKLKSAPAGKGCFGMVVMVCAIFVTLVWFCIGP